METLYIIDPNNFKGQIVSSITKHPYVDYTGGTTFEDYKKEENNEDLVALPWEDFRKDYYEPYLCGLQGEFKEVSEEAYWEALECLPPKRWTRYGKDEFFFMGECYTADLYSCYVRKGEKYYNALRSIHTKEEDLLNLKNIL